MLRASQAQPYSIDRLVGESEAMGRVRSLLRKVAVSPASTVLLTGESGTGKDLAAKVVHYASDRATKPFMNITCSALPEALLESELFGHERGAFTGADRQKRGLLESADGGTVFLDEIGEMQPILQAKLLRFLEERAFKRVGGAADIRVQVRVIAATNRDLEEEVKRGRFREDLYYRLNVMPVVMPSLRERPGDIPQLIAYYVDVFNREFRKHISRVAPSAMDRLKTYPWPGNVRELRNAVERAMLLAEGGELALDDFPILEKRAADRLVHSVVAPHGRSERIRGAPRRRHRSRSPRTLARHPGAAPERVEPDAGGRTPRPQPRSDPLSDREVQAGKASITVFVNSQLPIPNSQSQFPIGALVVGSWKLGVVTRSERAWTARE